MRNPDCLLVRVGELALKSKQVQRKWFRILLENIKTGLKEKKIKFELRTNPNRIFIYTKATGKTQKVLKNIYGITSFSPVWRCYSGINDINLLAVDIAEQVLEISDKDSFAIRSRRSGHHKFTSQLIAEEAGAAVKRVINAKVNLSNPDKEIFIECRSKSTYIFIDKITGKGGVPLGTAGKILAVVENKEDVAAAELMMKRGCELVVLGNNKKLNNALKKLHIGRNIVIIEKGDIENILKSQNLKALVVSEATEKKKTKDIEKEQPLVLRPFCES